MRYNTIGQYNSKYNRHSTSTAIINITKPIPNRVLVIYVVYTNFFCCCHKEATPNIKKIPPLVDMIPA